MALYSEKVMDHFQHPRNVGKLDDADGIGEVGNAKCGDIMKIYIKVRDGIIADVSVKVDYGYNVASLAFRIQQSIKHNVESMTKFKVDKINVHIQDVDFPDNLA